MAKQMWIRKSGIWRQVNNDGLYVKDGGSWRMATEGYVKDGGSWRQFHVASDPQTYTYDAAWSQTYQESGSKIWDGAGYDGDDDLFQGYWDSTSWGHVTGVIGFDYSQIQSDLGTRPNITSARLRLNVDNCYTTLGIYIRLGTHDKTSKPSTFLPSAMVDTNVIDTYSSQRLDEYTQEWITISDLSIIADLRDGVTTGLVLYEYTEGTYESSKELYRGIIEGSLSTGPRLEVTCDYGDPT